MPGDDTSLIDWKLYARSDRHYVKKFEEETNLECHVLFDVSGSMGYGSAEVTKHEYGSYLAASIAYLMNRQRDAVGLLVFADDVLDHLEVNRGPGHLRRLLVTLDRLEPGRASDLSKPLNKLAEALALSAPGDGRGDLGPP